MDSQPFDPTLIQGCSFPAEQRHRNAGDEEVPGIQGVRASLLGLWLFQRLSRCSFAVLLALGSAHAADISFSNQIAPLLTEKCVECHRLAKAKGGYRLDTFEALNKPGDSDEKPLVASKPNASGLYKLLVTDVDDDRMPRKADPLSKAEIELIKRWISDGAKFDGKDPKRLLSDLSTKRIAVNTPAKYPSPLPVTALAASPDGKLLAASGYGEVTLWDTATQRLAGRIGNLPERVTALRWLAPGTTLAVAGGTPGRSGELWLADVAQRKALKRLLTCPDTLQCLAVSPDGKYLAVGGTDNHVRLFDLPNGKLRWDVEGHADWVMALAFSPDSQLLASASRDRTARLFGAANGEIKATHDTHAAAVLSVVFAVDGQHVFSGAADGEIHSWNLEGTGDRKHGPARPTRAGVLQLAEGGKRIFASLADKGVVELDAEGRKVLRSFTPGTARVETLTFINEPPTLITGAQNGEVRLWDLKEDKERPAFVASPR